jgi:hypothetical protein
VQTSHPTKSYNANIHDNVFLCCEKRRAETPARLVSGHAVTASQDKAFQGPKSNEATEFTKHKPYIGWLANPTGGCQQPRTIVCTAGLFNFFPGTKYG